MTARNATTVLVVEDDRAVRESTVELLRSEGHEVVEAADGIEDLERLREVPLLCSTMKTVIHYGPLVTAFGVPSG
jgi:CheY-like chemotaxis protein